MWQYECGKKWFCLIDVPFDRFWRFRFVVIIKCQRQNRSMHKQNYVSWWNLLAIFSYMISLILQNILTRIALKMIRISAHPYTESGNERYPIWRSLGFSNKQTTFNTHFSQHGRLLRACRRAKPSWISLYHYYTVKFRRWFAVSQI